MKITIESTTKIVTLATPDGDVRARVWEGQTESGIPIHCYITRISVSGDNDCSQFNQELQEQRAPSIEVAAIPLRLIL